ncbi:MAG: hypothetical protein AVDCRST_MAG16-1268, partial [uncultured Frankineae bacterium]
ERGGPAVVLRPVAAGARQQRGPRLGGRRARRPRAAADRRAAGGRALPRERLALRLPPGGGGAQLPHHRGAGPARLLAAVGRGVRHRRAAARARRRRHLRGPGGRGGPARRLAPLPRLPAPAAL